MKLSVLDHMERTAGQGATQRQLAGDGDSEARRIQTITRLGQWFGHPDRATEHILSGASAQRFATLCVSLGRSIRE
jgi:hypothetical protein